MFTPTSQRPQAFPYQMDALDCLQNSPPLPKALRDVVETVIRVVLVPFALLADFAINSIRLIGNIFFSVSNWTEDPPHMPPVPIIPAVSQAALESPLPVQLAVSPSPTEELLLEVEQSQVSRTSFSGTSEDVIPPSTVTPSQNSPRSLTSKTDSPPPSLPRATEVPSQAVIAKELPACGETERGLITELITTIAGTNTVFLAGKATRLTEIGNAIKTVHPLTFLITAVSTPALKQHLRAILDDGFPYAKSKGFLKQKNGNPPLSLTDKLTNGTANKSFDPYWADFAQKTKIQPQTLLRFVETKDWAGLIKHLCSIQG